MHDKNKHLGSVTVSPTSTVKVWWSCPDCPDGHKHMWEATIKNRSKGTGCPFCSGSKVCQHNSLATKAPDVVRYWHPQKNKPLTPESVTAKSARVVNWRCPACSHEWESKIAAKVSRSSGCPECARGKPGYSRDGVRQKHPSFASCNHPLLSQWDHRLNAQEGNFPDKVTLGSKKMIWWVCDQCPQGCKHSWQAAPTNRAGKVKENCPFCSGHRGNSLQTLFPDIAADFDIAANGLTPNVVTASSSRKFRWLSDRSSEAPLRSVDQRTRYTRRRSAR